MKAITIVTTSRRFGVCRSCRAPLEWAINSVTNKPIPFNAPIVIQPMLDLPADVQRVDLARTTSHFATCPQANDWRKQKK